MRLFLDLEFFFGRDPRRKSDFLEKILQARVRLFTISLLPENLRLISYYFWAAKNAVTILRATMRSLRRIVLI